MYDFIITGQGLAGSILACRLIALDKKVLVINSPISPSASKAAAGLYNPLLVKRFRKAWLADTLFPLIEPFYKQLEIQLNCKGSIIFPKTLLHIFESQAMQNDWSGKLSEEGMDVYVNGIVNADGLWFDNPFGALSVKQSGWVNTNVLLEAAKKYLIENNSYVEDHIDHSELIQNEGKWQYKNYSAHSVICCEGAALNRNRYFSHVPLNPVKGETLSIEIPGLKAEYNIHKGVFLMPVEDGLYKAGSTYEWDDLSDDITEKAREEIVEKLNGLLIQPYEIKEQQAGVRPSAHDRRPILGEHPNYKNLYICNGLGTKGVSLLPYFSEILIDHCFNGTKIDPEQSVSRFNKHLKVWRTFAIIGNIQNYYGRVGNRIRIESDAGDRFFRFTTKQH